MKKKSIFLVGAMILMIGGQIASGNHILLASSTNLENEVQSTSNIQTSSEECLHENLIYTNAGLTHNIECEYCHADMGSEAHVDNDNDMCCDACKVKFSTVAPTTGEGYVSSTLTLNESVKISIKANEDEVNGIVISSWYENDMEERLSTSSDENGKKTYSSALYSAKAEYNQDTGLYEAIVNFEDVNGEDGTYYFDAVIYGKTSSMRYVRLSYVEYVKNGISTVSTTRTSDGNIEVYVKAVDGGEIYIATNGEEPTETSNWIPYEANETYTLEDENDAIKEVSVYYRSASTFSLAAAVPVTLSVNSTEDITAMVTEWTITEANTEIKLPVSGTGLNIIVNWGDGTSETVTNEFPVHTYTSSGTYDITITGNCPVFGYTDLIEVDETSNYYTFTKYLTGVKQFGELSATRYGFSNCTKLKYVSGDATENTFNNVTDMSNMFAFCKNLKDIDLSNFNTSNVKNMSNMFFVCVNLNSIDASSFNTSNVENMERMFSTCNFLNYLDISSFDTSNVTNFNSFLMSCNKLEEIDLSNLNVSKATNLSNMFAYCSTLTQLDVSEFKLFNNCNLNGMFNGCKKLKDLDLSFVDASKVSGLDRLLYGNECLEKIIVNEKFTCNGTDMFTGASNLKGIIITSETPVANQFLSVKDEIPNVIFYVPNQTAETAYETAWTEDYTIDRIKPILQLAGDKEVTIGTYEDYDIDDYLVAEIDVSNSGEYTKFGYSVEHNSTVKEDTLGTYEHEYILTRTIDGLKKTIMSVTKKVTVIKKAIVAPGEFKATQQGDEKIITLTWQKHKDPNAKYELSYKDLEGNWNILSNNADTPYSHSGLNPSESYEYRLRAYDADGYSSYTYTQGSTKPIIISGDTILDTVKPIINFVSYSPLDKYSKIGSSFEVLFNVTDENYYSAYNKTSGDTVNIMIGTERVPDRDITIEKEAITNGENVKIIVKSMPNIASSGEIKVIIPANTIQDKALNGNIEMEYETPIIYFNSNITKNAPNVEVEYNKVTLTCNQTTDIEPESVVIYYEYRKSGDTEYTRTDNNVIEGLEGNTYYEFRTSLRDITGNEVSSEVVVKFVESVTPDVSLKVVSQTSGSYAYGTTIKIEAKFTKPLKTVTNPILIIKFGEGKNITLDGEYDEISNTINYNYTIALNDLGKLTGINFKGKVRALDGEIIEYDFVPTLDEPEIFARTGARKIDPSGDVTYYPYIQDAIYAINDNNIEETIEQLLKEENVTAILVGTNKKVFLYQNGNDIIVESGENKAFVNRGELTIKEDHGTGKIEVYTSDSAIGIENYGTLNILNGYIQVKTENTAGSAIAIYNYGTVVLGKDDNIVSEQTPIIDSTEFGIYTSSTGIFEFYDGVIMGARGKSYYGEITTCDGYNIVTENIETAREKTYLGVDRIPPKIDYEILTSGWRKDFVNVKIKVFDEDSGVKQVSLNNEELTMEADLTKELQFDENGEYVVYAEDNVGNSSYKIIEINTIDKEAPNILSITSDEEISETEVKVLVTVRDYQSGLAGIIIKNVDETPTDTEDWILLDKYPTSKQIIPVVIQKGERNYCFAKDRAGNIRKYNGEIIVEYIDKIAPVIQSAKIVKENGKEYIIGKTVLVDVIATDNVGVTDILITSQNMSDTEANASDDWKEYTRYNIYKLPVEGDKIYTIYIWVKDAAGNISLHATADAELKALIIGDNEYDYVGSDTIYNKSKLRFRVKDWNYNYDGTLVSSDVMLRLTSGDKIIRNVTTGLTLKKISDYVSVESDNYQYKGEIYELDMENIPGTGNLSLVILGGAVSDLARNTIKSVVKLTDIFIDNNAPKINVVSTETYDEDLKQIRNVTVVDNENNLIQAIEVYSKGLTKTCMLTNGKISLGLLDGEKIIAYDKAGNKLVYTVGSSVEPMLSSEKYDVSLEYGGEAEKFGYVYNGDGVIYIESSDTTIANASINIATKEIMILPVNAGSCEVTVRALETKNYMEAKMKIQITVKKRPVTLEWSNGIFDYDGTEKQVTATVKNIILGDSVPIGEYKNNIKITSGKYKAEVLSVDNNNYTVEGGTNITFDWEINKIDRVLTLDKQDVSIRMPDTETINFTYTGEEVEGIEATISGENLVEPKIKEAHGEGEILLNPLTVGHSTTLILNIPESTNYNSMTANINVRVTKLLTVFFDAQGGTPEYHTRTVEYDEPYGELPISTNGVRTFIGWFTEKEGKGTLITEDTIVSIKDKHTLYACWNRAPENVTVSVKSKTTSSITLIISSEDKDGDDLTYDVYLEGKYKGVTSKVAQGKNVEYTLSGLSRYTYYSYYVIASDGMQETKSNVGSTRTYCPGDDYTCYATYCDGYTHTTVTCSNCGGDGIASEYCSGGYSSTCSSCGGDGRVTYTCSAGSSSEKDCSICGGSGSCPGSPEEVSSYTFTCSNGHTDATHYEYECKTCGITGQSEYCPHWENNVACIQWGTNNHADNCGGCGGSGKVGSTTTCSHGYTSSHEATRSCSNCGGDGEVDYSCSHGYMSSHYYDTTCSSCGGDGDVDNATRPCRHGYSSSHYYCTHISKGSSSTHKYCEHGRVGQHDD